MAWRKRGWRGGRGSSAGLRRRRLNGGGGARSAVAAGATTTVSSGSRQGEASAVRVTAEAVVGLLP